MKQFTFRLQGLLRIRRLAEKEAEGALKEAQRRLKEAERRVTIAREEYLRGVAEWRRRLTEAFGSEDISLAFRDAQKRRQRKRDAEEHLNAVWTETVTLWDDYRRRRREREIVEALRERQWQRWQKEWEHFRQRFADERALRDFAVKERDDPEEGGRSVWSWR